MKYVNHGGSLILESEIPAKVENDFFIPEPSETMMRTINEVVTKASADLFKQAKSFAAEPFESIVDRGTKITSEILKKDVAAWAVFRLGAGTFVANYIFTSANQAFSFFNSYLFPGGLIAHPTVYAFLVGLIAAIAPIFGDAISAYNLSMKGAIWAAVLKWIFKR